MTSLLPLPSGDKAKPRKDLSATSIPTLMALEEEINYSPSKLTVKANGSDTRKYSDSSLPSATANVTQKSSKTSRRSSLGFGLLGGKNDNKTGKRRSSIAVVFLGRRNSKVCNLSLWG